MSNNLPNLREQSPPPNKRCFQIGTTFGLVRRDTYSKNNVLTNKKQYQRDAEIEIE